MTEKVAKLVKALPPNKVGAVWHVYKVDPPIEYDEDREATYVVVSANTVPYSGPETYIFPSTDGGEVTDWLELEGSYRGGLDHAAALGNAGYTVTE